MNDELIGNLTTIIMYILSTLGGGAIIETLGGESQSAVIIGALLGLVYAIINSYYPNNFKILGNATQPSEPAEALGELNEDYIYPLNNVDDNDEDGC